MRLGFIYLLLFPKLLHAQVFGFVKEKDSGEPLVGASVFFNGSFVFTDNQGFFSIAEGSTDTLKVKMVGFESKEIPILNQDYPITILLSTATTFLEEVTIRASLSESSSPNFFKLSARQVLEIPALAGEKDVIKAIQLSPGVQKGAEGSTSLYVRGGRPDQNLITLDQAVIYNPNHFFGLFSVFNPSALKEVQFHKSAFPAEMGGRLSSFLQVVQNEGDKSEHKGDLTIGLLSSRISVEGPLRKNKSSFILSARRTNLGAISWIINSPREKINYHFFDLNTKLSFQPTPRDKIYLSAYLGNDLLSFENNRFGPVDTAQTKNSLGWGNAAFISNWFHVFKEGGTLESHVSYTRYNSNLEDVNTRGKNQRRNFGFTAGVEDFSLKTMFGKSRTKNLEYVLGMQLNQRRFTPKDYFVENDAFAVEEVGNQQLFATEAAVFSSLLYTLDPKAKLTLGLRLSSYYSSQFWFLIEPRVNFSTSILNNYVLNISYDRTTQTLGLLQSAGYGLPTDLFITIGSPLQPQICDQLAVGVSKFFGGKWETTSSTFIKSQQNLISYQNGVWLFNLINELGEFSWEENITSGSGLSYGIENMLKYSSSKLNGWICYTWQRSLVLFPELNNGKPFYPFGDRRHDLSIFGSYRLGEKWTLGGTFIYTSGLPVTSPQGFYFTQNVGRENFSGVNFYDGLNGSRLPDYHRLDISASRKKERSKITNIWEFSIYNVYNRKNPFSEFVSNRFTPEGRQVQIEYTYLLPIIPSISYTLKF